MSKSVQSKTTAAFYMQSVLSFGLSLTALTAGVYFLPVDGWIRAFFTVGVFYVVTSCFNLAKCVRDKQDEAAVVSRVDQARLDKLLAEHDPFRVDT